MHIFNIHNFINNILEKGKKRDFSFEEKKNESVLLNYLINIEMNCAAQFNGIDLNGLTDYNI